MPLNRKTLKEIVLRQRLLPGLVLLLMAGALPLAWAQDGQEVRFGDTPITPTGTVSTSIGVPRFDLVGETEGLPQGFFADIVYNDLEMFSDFKRARNQHFVNETHERDLRNTKRDYIDYAEWQRLGCDFVLKGAYQMDKEGRITCEIRLFDVTYAVRTLGLRYKHHTRSNARSLAHQISDDVVKAVFPDEIGIASTQIVFVSQVPGARHKEIYLMDADGHNMKRLTYDESISATPCWGMNATEIYFTSYKDVNPDLCGYQLGTRKNWFISRRPGLNFAPSWSQRINRLVLTLGRDGNSEIYSMDRSGQERSLSRLTRNRGIDSSPCWNPAGNQMVFTSDRTGRPQIWVMDADGSNQRRLTHHGYYSDAAVWSPRGDKIAFVSRDGNFDIYTMNIDGSDLRQLTYNAGSNEDPAWAPDGRHLVFSSNRTGHYELYVMRADGSKVHRLTHSQNSQSAAWSPLLRNR